MITYNDIINHYKTNYSHRIFHQRLTHEDGIYYIMYIYDYDTEFDNYSNTFLKYFPFYVRNEDQLSTLDERVDIDTQLAQRSRSIWKTSKIVPRRAIASNGVYGELFLDYYLRIIQDKKAFITYANKRSFSSNYETTGIDNVAYYIENDEINLCICEAKFVSGASDAKNNLISDINGDEEKPGHISKIYLDDYFQFIAEKTPNVSNEDKQKIQHFLNELNIELDNGNNFVDLLIKKNIHMNFVFFAIFKSKKRQPNLLLNYYEEIYNECEKSIKDIGFTNYNIEIVFIPTNNKSIDIKKRINKEYE